MSKDWRGQSHFAADWNRYWTAIMAAITALTDLLPQFDSVRNWATAFIEISTIIFYSNVLEIFSFLCSPFPHKTHRCILFTPRWMLAHQWSTDKFTLLTLVASKLHFAVSTLNYITTAHCLGYTLAFISHPESVLYCSGISNKQCIAAWRAKAMHLRNVQLQLSTPWQQNKESGE